jgi:RNA polymerase sigma-70 factor (ECF subfamily)
MTSLPNVSDEYLIQQFVHGDLLAFDSLYNRHVKAVYNRVRYVIPETDVEDVTQEVFLAALCSLPAFRGEAQFSTWLRTLANNKVAEYYRRRSRKKETMQVDLVHAERSSDQSSTSSLEDRIALYSALNQLPKQYCEVIILRFAEGMQFNEIAKLLKKNPEAIKSLFRRAISALREKMEVKDEQTSKK